MGATGEGGEPLDVHAEQPGDGLGLGVTELGELLGHAPHGAVPLAELHAGETAGADGAGRGGEAVLGHRLDEEIGPGHDVVARGGEARGIPALEAADPFVGEGRDGLGSTVRGEVAQGLDGELVVVGRERPVAPLGDDVGAGRAAPPAGVSRGVRRAGVVLLDGAVLGEGVEVPADRCGRQTEEPADLGGGDGPCSDTDASTRSRVRCSSVPINTTPL